MKGSGLALPKGNYFYFNTNSICGEAIPQEQESYSPKSELSTPNSGKAKPLITLKQQNKH